MRKLKAAYAAGYRAGMARKPLIVREDGTKVLGRPRNPYKPIRQFLLSFFWEEGVYAGMMESHEQWRQRKRNRYVR